MECFNKVMGGVSENSTGLRAHISEDKTPRLSEMIPIKLRWMPDDLGWFLKIKKF